jgi:vacuolar protein sorting-associated protein 13A/C
MKIPWSSLYTAPVELNLQDLFLLVTPSYSVKYDEQAEEKSMLAAKQAEIARLDLARAKERLKHGLSYTILNYCSIDEL